MSIRRILAAAAIVSMCLASTGASHARADVVAVTPVLTFLSFGATVGLPLVCSTALSAVGSGLAEGSQDLAEALGDDLVGANEACAEGALQGATFLRQLEAAMEPLAVFNDALIPVLDELAVAFERLGADLGPSIAPFGPTVRELGPMIRWLRPS